MASISTFDVAYPLHGKIVKPTRAKDQEGIIKGKYVIRWEELRDGRGYTRSEANPGI